MRNALAHHPVARCAGDLQSPATRARWLKADLHLHSAEDPIDVVEASALELVERAHRLGFQALAITLHTLVFADPGVFARAAELGILLIPAAELRVEGADVVVLNISPAEAAALRTFADLRRLRAKRGKSLCVFAPHPCYVFGGSIGRARLVAQLDLFDAIEYSHLHFPGCNLNRPAMRLAASRGLPLLATSDAHQRRAFGRSYSWLKVAAGDPADPAAERAALTVEAIFAAIRAGRIRRVSPAYGPWRLAALLWFLFVLHPLRKWRRRQAETAAARGRRVPVGLRELPIYGERNLVRRDAAITSC